ncbi:MFS transporter [Candidatus Poriferisodalis sp.]|uniref:MFS transporter n=1 Tax=Candidatus Poriferisodalis sp. TaxID=3101277 RepID=UPI003B02D3DE
MDVRPTPMIPASIGLVVDRESIRPVNDAAAAHGNGAVNAATTPSSSGRGRDGLSSVEDVAKYQDSARAWWVAIGASLATGMAFGTIYTFGAFMAAMSAEFGTGNGPTALMIGIATFLFFGTGILSGPLLHRVGPRPLLIAGGVLFFGGLALTSAASAIWQGYIFYGLGCGFGSGLFVAPLMATAAASFVRLRAISQGVVASGPGLGTALLVPVAQWLIENFGWRPSFRYLALASLVVFAVCAVMVRPVPVSAHINPKAHVQRVLRTKAFRHLAVGAVLFSIPLIGSLAMVIRFATADGIDAFAAGRLVSAIGFSSIVGRLLLTSVARAVGSVRLMKFAYGTLPVAYAIWLFAGDRYWQLMTFALVLGFAYGGFVALMGDVTAHLFGVVGIGSVMGVMFIFFGAGALIGPTTMGYLSEYAGGSTIPIAVVTVVALAGALSMLPMPRDPVPLPPPTEPFEPSAPRNGLPEAPVTAQAAVGVTPSAHRPRRALPADLVPPSVWRPIPATAEGAYRSRIGAPAKA